MSGVDVKGLLRTEYVVERPADTPMTNGPALVQSTDAREAQPAAR
jgi:hypothetical protein